MEFQDYGGYCLPRAMPEYDKWDSVLPELCTLAWITAIIYGARTFPFPMNILFGLWTIGIFACIPVAAWLGARNDRKTTVIREVTYFLRSGLVGVRIVGWPITLVIAYFKRSEREDYLSDFYMEFRKKNYYAKHDTALQIAKGRASEIDQMIDSVELAANKVLDVAVEVPAVACRTTMVAATLAGAVHAQNPTTNPTTSVVIARTGQNIQAPYTGTYHLVEALQVRDKWIFPDVGYVDFATGNYRELFVGGGRTLYDRKKVSITGELYFVQATGPASKNARYLWPNAIVDIRFTPKLTSQTSYILYAPLNKPARVQQVIERSKLEFAPSKHWKFGGGYGAYQYGNGPWQSKPFATTTISTKAGSFEFWLQNMSQDAQVQLRYSFAHTGKP